VLEHEFALVLLDVDMPDMDGYQVAEMLKGVESTRYLPILFVTAAYKDDLHRLKGYDAGAVDYLEKPVDDRILLGKVRVFLELDRNIKERIRAEQALKRLNATLEQRVREEVAKNREKDHLLIQQSRLAAMGEMIHNIAHQWRQPLNALSIILGNIVDDYDYHELTRDSLAESVAQAQRLIQRMSTTVDDFRDFFRPDREPGDFDMGKAVEDALFILEAALRNNQIEVARSLPPGITVHGYSNQFAQIVLNVIVNAKEAIRLNGTPGGRIAVELGTAGGQGILTVQDNGGGIPESVLPKIFDPYFTTKEQGSGIGLYMSKMILERNLGGTIAVTNHGPGALATITLPLATQ
jgi:two-component system sensor histidine kinase/response regulator